MSGVYGGLHNKKERNGRGVYCLEGEWTNTLAGFYEFYGSSRRATIRRYKRPAKIYLWGWVQVVGARALSSHCHSSDGMPARVAAWAVSKEITVPTFTKLASSEDLGPELEPIPEQPETAPAPDRSLPVNATISGRAQMLILSGLCLQTVCDVMLRSWSRRTLGETYSSSSVLMVRQPPAQLAQGPAISPSISHPHEPSGCRAR